MIQEIAAAVLYTIVATLPNGNEGTYKQVFTDRDSCEARLIELRVEYPLFADMRCVDKAAENEKDEG